MTASAQKNETATSIVMAAKAALLSDGYSGLSTRRIAEQADVPLSQIHYHFGSKQNLVLAVLNRENQRLLARQEEMFESDLPLWQQWDLACDFLEDDLDSGYVRVLHELFAAGWSDQVVAEAVWRQMKGWNDLLVSVSRRAAARFGDLGTLTAEEMASLVSAAFIGAESYILLGVTEQEFPIRGALRKLGILIRLAEEAVGDEG